MQQLTNGIYILPIYIIIIGVCLAILPTFLALIMRYSLYRYLQFLVDRMRRLLLGIRPLENTQLVDKIERRLEINTCKKIENINTSALIYGIYVQETFKILCLRFRCEVVDRFCHILPNLLLAFGLLGTFLGITINLTSLSQAIAQINVNDIGSSIEKLNRPLQGIGIAFITSLIAIACSSLLTIFYSIWNTNLTKSELLTALEDYIDNIYLPQLEIIDSAEDNLQSSNQDAVSILSNFSAIFEDKIAQLVDRLEQSTHNLSQAARDLEESQFADKISLATNDLNVVQDRFSQSFLVVQQSLQSLEKSVQKILDLGGKIEDFNSKQISDLEIDREKNIQAIKTELAHLITKLDDR